MIENWLRRFSQNIPKYPFIKLLLFQLSFSKCYYENWNINTVTYYHINTIQILNKYYQKKIINNLKNSRFGKMSRFLCHLFLLNLDFQIYVVATFCLCVPQHVLYSSCSDLCTPAKNFFQLFPIFDCNIIISSGCRIVCLCP